MIYVFSLIFTTFHATFLGNSSTCAENDPCDYKKIIDIASKKDLIIFHDHQISSSEHLKNFHFTASKLLSNGISIQGKNTIIDGSLSDFFSPSLIFINGTDDFEVSIQNFTFCQFKSSIIHVKNITKITLSNCVFHDNYIDQKISILTFAFCNAILSNVKIHLCSIHDSSLISSHSSNILFLQSIIDNNFCMHSSANPLFFFINSNISMNHSIIIRNSSPYSPLIKALSSPNHYNHLVLALNNASFVSNQNTILLSIDKYMNVNTKDSYFFANMGRLLIASKQSTIDIKNSIFEHNYSPSQSYIEISNSSLMIRKNCEFKHNSINSLDSNHQSSLIYFNGYLSRNIIKNSSFISNKIDDSMLFLNDQAHLTIESCLFEDSQANNFVIGGVDSILTVTESNFNQSWSPAILFNKSQINISKTNFKSSFAFDQLSLKCVSSTVFIEDSLINHELVTNNRTIHGNVTFRNIISRSKQKIASSSNPSKISNDQNDDNESGQYLLYIFYIIPILILIFIFFARVSIKKIIRRIIRRFRYIKRRVQAKL